MATRRTLGLIAGLGQLPAEIARGARDRGCRVVGLGLKGFNEPELERLVDEWHEVELGCLGLLMDLLGQSQVSDVVLAGSVGKRAFFDALGGLRLDERATGVLQRLKDHDDDAILGAVVSEIEAQGIRVCSQGEWVPHLLPPAGFSGRTGRPGSSSATSILAFRWPWPWAGWERVSVRLFEAVACSPWRPSKEPTPRFEELARSGEEERLW